jgi:UDP-glucuronate decarboxylase
VTNPIVAEDFDYILDRLTADERRTFQDSIILITGCAGFLGYYFMLFLIRHAAVLGIRKIIGLDNFMLHQPDWIHRIAREHPNLVAVHPFDIITGDIAAVPAARDADLIIHMASIASPMFYRKYPIETLDANIWGLRRLLDLFRDRPLKGLLFFSSSEIYGDPTPDQVPTDEEYRGNVAAIGPRACYDEAKRFGETMCSLFAEQHGMPIRIARPFNNYGPGMRLEDTRVPADFAKMIFENRDIEMYSDGTPTRTFCYIADAIAGYLKILVYGKFDYFNIGIETPEISVRELADLYVQHGRAIFGYTGQARFAQSADSQYLKDNPSRRCPRIDKARRLLGYAPTITVADGVGRFLQFIKLAEGRL